MDVSKISVEAIMSMVNEMELRMRKIEEQADLIMDQYTAIQTNGWLQSNDIDPIVNATKAKIDKMKGDFATMATTLRTTLNSSGEALAINQQRLKSEISE